MELISIYWLAILMIAAGWTTFFSLFSGPIRGWRNFGLLACFAIGFIMLFVLPWRSALATWGVVGAASGLLYFLYELYSRLTSKPEDEVQWPRLTTVVHGLFLWPIMLPEVIEYWLADLGVLRSRATTPQGPAQ
ncbi:hypothetical protein [Paludisphaera rhizosphaerae]|uniref:hypothetical protein n=1 Tax=Paludisphaera rhizosphaerae TaxID=2711216 RepID=UPI0013EA5E0B|nr:hypothetical protein [Paludisphaera rhizosphaerae]